MSSSARMAPIMVAAQSNKPLGIQMYDRELTQLISTATVLPRRCGFASSARSRIGSHGVFRF